MENVDLNKLRNDMRKADELRPVVMEAGIAPSSSGSVLIKMGNTEVICAASVDENIPRWMRAQNVQGGWLTAEYRMLPYATDQRKQRASAVGKIDGRTQEIQRLIGRSLRAVVDLKKLGPRTVWIDCDVLRADGGTRTASVTGAYVAMRLAVDQLLKDKKLAVDPILDSVAAVSVGIIHGQTLLDLCYTEDFEASVDMNVVMTGNGRFVEVQGTAEESPYTQAELDAMTALAAKGIRELTVMQNKTVQAG